MRPILEGCRRDCNPYFADIFAAIFAGLPILARALLYPLQKNLQIIVAPQWGCGNMWTVKQGTTTQGAANMSKGNAVKQFSTGQHVEFSTDVGYKQYRKEDDPERPGKTKDVFVRKINMVRTDTGRIVKLHKSGSHGVAEIVPDNMMPGTDSRKVSRRLQHVKAVSQ